MKDTTKQKISSSMGELFSPEGFQKYFLGYKSSGVPRSVYDIVRDFTGITTKEKDNKKKKKYNKKHSDSTFSLYLTNKKGKKKKNKKKNKYWHI